MEASWHPNRSKIDADCEKRFFEKSCSHCSGDSKLGGSEGPSWQQRPTENRSKNEVKMGRPLGIDFLSIFLDLGGQVGSENGAKIIKNGIEKNSEKRKGNEMAKKSQEETPE